MVAHFSRMVRYNGIITAAVILFMAIGAVGGSGCLKPYIDNGHETHRSGKPLLYPRAQYRIGFTVFLSCNPGYSMEGSREIQCDSNSEWSPLLPYCAPVTCPQLNVPNAHITSQSGEDMTWKAEYIFSDTVKLHCAIGYQMRGGSEIQCGSDGKWSDLPACQPVFCTEPEVKNGHIVHKHTSEIVLGAGHRFSDAVKVLCDTGYIVRGGNEIWCQSDGKWSALPTCEPVFCPEPEVKNGHIVHKHTSEITLGAGHRFSDVVKVLCDTGYIVRGGNEIWCQSDGKWSALPTCEPANCGPPTSLQFAVLGKMHADKDTFPVGSTVNYNCIPGFVRMSGKISVATCTEDSQWSEISEFCRPRTCGSPGEVHSGKFEVNDFIVGSIATLFCDTGYRIAGSRTHKRCLETGMWSNDELNCEPILCEPPPDVPNAVRSMMDSNTFAYLSSVSYDCKIGALHGNKSIYCTEHGNWSALAPECIDVSCLVPTVQNGILQHGTTSKVPYGDIMHFRCNRGYRPESNSTIQCGRDGLWHPAYPVCISEFTIICPTPEVKNGYIEDIGAKQFTFGAGYRYLDSIAIVCEIGFKIKGLAVIKCGVTGSWTPYLPTCEPVSCPTPDVKHGQISKSNGDRRLGAGYKFKDSFEVLCDAGYIVCGGREVRCEADGKWSPAVPTCEPVSFIERHSMPIPGLHGQTLLHAGIGDEGRKTCHEKFLPLGRQEFTCTEKDTVDPAMTRVVPVSANTLCASVARTMKDHWKEMNIEDKYLHLEMGKVCLDIISLYLQIEKMNATQTPSKPSWWQRVTSIGFS